MAELNDEVLAKQAQAGDREAFFKLYQRYLRKVYNRVKSRIPPDHAEDVTQEVFVAVVRSLPQFAGNSSFNTWLYTIVNRKIADFYRALYRHHQAESLDEHEDGNLIAESVDVDEQMVLHQALQHLSDTYQEVILLRFAEGLEFASIAQRIGKSLEATKSLYRRAIQALTERLELTNE